MRELLFRNCISTKQIFFQLKQKCIPCFVLLMEKVPYILYFYVKSLCSGCDGTVTDEKWLKHRQYTVPYVYCESLIAIHIKYSEFSIALNSLHELCVTFIVLKALLLFTISFFWYLRIIPLKVVLFQCCWRWHVRTCHAHSKFGVLIVFTHILCHKCLVTNGSYLHTLSLYFQTLKRKYIAISIVNNTVISVLSSMILTA